MAKVSRSRYKSYGKSQRFQNRGDRLSASVDRIRQQRNIEIDGLKTLAANEEKNAELRLEVLELKEALRSKTCVLSMTLKTKLLRIKQVLWKYVLRERLNL